MHSVNKNSRGFKLSLGQGLTAIGSLFLISVSYAQIYKTLPRGVRMFGYRNVTTSTINSNFNQSQAETPLAYGINANAANLASIGNSVNYYMQQLKAISPEAYDAFSYGQYKLSGEANLNVNGFGLGYGVTDRLTVYGILPYYSANVRVKYKQLKASNTQQVADILAQHGVGDGAAAIANITAALPSASASTLQSVIVNTYGYKELGDWTGTGYGDMELGATYSLLDAGYYGMSLTGGTVVPTGRQDDPNLLQDIAFGDGQWDVFAETATGYSVSDRFLLGSYLRYTYQAPAEKTLRVPTDRDFTLSSQKGKFDVKFGDRVDMSILAKGIFNDWLSITPTYEFYYQMPSRYQSAYGAANSYLAYNSDRMGHVAKLTASISSIQPYLKKQFLLPGMININIQETVAGKNVPKVGRFEVELKLLF